MFDDKKAEYYNNWEIQFVSNGSNDETMMKKGAELIPKQHQIELMCMSVSIQSNDKYDYLYKEITYSELVMRNALIKAYQYSPKKG